MGIGVKEKVKILFIDQPSQSLGLHNGLAMLAAMLNSCNCEFYILDLRNLNINVDTTGFVAFPKSIDYDKIREAIARFSPQVIGISVRSTLFNQTKEIVFFLKSNFPDILIMAGGSHMGIDGDGFMNELPVDIGVIGEAEFTIQELCLYFQGEKKISSIKGIIYRENENLFNTGPRDFINDLENLPFPSFDRFSSVMANKGFIPSYPIVTSRGCPYSCTFCLSPLVSGKKWRSRSPESIAGELDYAKRAYKIKRVNFMEDNFNLDLERAKKILTLMITKFNDLVIDFLAGLRVEMIDDEFVRLIADSKVKCVAMGIESADDEVRKCLRKGVSIEKTVDSIKKLKKAGVNTQTFFIIGLPGSTYEKDLYSIKFAKELGISTYWTIANAYPNTEMMRWVSNNGRFLSDYKTSSMTFLDEATLNFDTVNYPAEKRKEAFERALISTRRFDRLEYSERGIRRHLKISRLIFHYEKKAVIVYQIYAALIFIRRILLKLNLYNLVVKIVNPTFVKRFILNF